MDQLEIAGTAILSALGIFSAWKGSQWVDYLLHAPHKRTIGKKMGMRIDHFAATGERL